MKNRCVWPENRLYAIIIIDRDRQFHRGDEAEELIEMASRGDSVAQSGIIGEGKKTHVLC